MTIIYGMFVVIDIALAVLIVWGIGQIIRDWR